MNRSLAPALVHALRTLVLDLASGRFSQLEAGGRLGRLTAVELRAEIERYGRTLAPLPEGSFDVDVYPVDGARSASWLDLPLWTEEEGRSDLTLSLVATKDGETYRVEMCDIHVL
jgi:hypothetical protein